MQKFLSIKCNSLLTILILMLMACETPNQHNLSVTPQSYTQLDPTNIKDKEFYGVLENNLKKLGTLGNVYVDIAELNAYRKGKRSYPTNYRYEIKVNPKTSLEDLKQASLNLG